MGPNTIWLVSLWRGEIWGWIHRNTQGEHTENMKTAHLSAKERGLGHILSPQPQEQPTLPHLDLRAHVLLLFKLAGLWYSVTIAPWKLVQGDYGHSVGMKKKIIRKVQSCTYIHTKHNVHIKSNLWNIICKSIINYCSFQIFICFSQKLTYQADKR